VADYSHSLLEGLRQLVEVQVGRSGDVNLYHLGNNQLHREIYFRALKEPGVVVLHDAVLQHFFLGLLSREEYVEEFVFNYGEWNRGVGERLWRERARSGADAEYFRYPMLRRIVDRSRAVIVHNSGAAEMVRAHNADTPIVEIPLLFDGAEVVPPEASAHRREEWGITPGTFLFAIFGHMRESKRVLPVIRVFERVHQADPNTALLIAGECGSRAFESALQSHLPSPGVIREGYAEERRFWENASAVDACLNLRYPAAGETSFITVRLMGLGKPVLVSEGKETARFPESTCVRVDTGPAEEDMLLDYMLWLSRCPQDARAIGSRARQYVLETHAVDLVARRYVETLLKFRT
jgi:glycosyltransferase involved in cell wall biosynthesis